MKVTFKLK